MLLPEIFDCKTSDPPDFFNHFIVGVSPQMVDFGSGQGLSDFETGGIACYFEDFKRAKTPPRAGRCRLWIDTN